MRISGRIVVYSFLLLAAGGAGGWYWWNSVPQQVERALVRAAAEAMQPEALVGLSVGDALGVLLGGAGGLGGDLLVGGASPNP